MCKCLLSKVECNLAFLQKQLEKGSNRNSIMITINSIKPE